MSASIYRFRQSALASDVHNVSVQWIDGNRGDAGACAARGIRRWRRNRARIATMTKVIVNRRKERKCPLCRKRAVRRELLRLKKRAWRKSTRRGDGFYEIG